MFNIHKFKTDYNSLLSRFKKAEEYMEKASPEQFEKWKPEFIKIIIGLSTMIKQYEKETGKKMSRGEVLQGFGGNL